jgi:RimJ/RimL family protein N-acetyltransferase
MTVFETPRLVLRHLAAEDAAFVLELLNDPDWLRYIGDRGVRDLEGAREYIRKGPAEMYERLGFGLWAVERQGVPGPIGICGILKRETLDDVDLGFAFLPGFRGKGYAVEAAKATLAYGRDELGLSRIVAITSKDNERSGKLLEKIGFRFERMIQMARDPRSGSDPEELKLFSWSSPRR